MYNSNPNFTWSWDSVKKGYTITNNSDNSKSIFLPAAGYINQMEYKEIGTGGNYWSNIVCSNITAYQLDFNDNNVSPLFNYDRHLGYTIRPVRLEEVP